MVPGTNPLRGSKIEKLEFLNVLLDPGVRRGDDVIRENTGARHQPAARVENRKSRIEN